jgi:putative oxidoreductase
MNTITGLGKYLFAIPFAVFGVLHFLNAEEMAPMAFGSTIIVYITGVCLIAASVSMLIGKKDKLAAILLALFLIGTAVLVHIKAMSGGDEMAMGLALRDLALAGAALMYAHSIAQDRS